jgi:hypothetical protein
MQKSFQELFDSEGFSFLVVLSEVWLYQTNQAHMVSDC